MFYIESTLLFLSTWHAVYPFTLLSLFLRLKCYWLACLAEIIYCFHWVTLWSPFILRMNIAFHPLLAIRLHWSKLWLKVRSGKKREREDEKGSLKENLRGRILIFPFKWICFKLRSAWLNIDILLGWMLLYFCLFPSFSILPTALETESIEKKDSPLTQTHALITQSEFSYSVISSSRECLSFNFQFLWSGFLT